MFNANPQGIPTGHLGGTVGQGALRMHSGGMIGLKRDEVPIIAQTGERVQSRAEVSSSGGSRSQVSNTYNINAVDASSFFQLLNRDPGMVASVVEKAQMSGNHPSRRRRDER